MARSFGNTQRQAAPPVKPAQKPAAKPAQKTGTAVAKPVAEKANLPASFLQKQLAAAGRRAGFENITSREMSVPFWKVVDKSSGVAIDGSDAYIDGCLPGMIHNSVTNELVASEDGLLVVACGFKSVIIEYNSTEPGSGFVGEHPISSNIKDGGEFDDNGRFVLPNGHCLVDAYNYSVLADSGSEEFSAAMISMSGSNQGVGRQWNTMMANRKAELPDGQRFTPATYGVLYRLRTRQMKKDKFVWYVWEITDEGLVQDEALFTRAEDLNQLTLDNRVQGNYAGGGQTEAGAEEPDTDKKIPY